MPCNSDYLNATTFERDMSRVILLLKEIATGIPVNPSSPEWQGYLPGIFITRIPSKEEADKLVAGLCYFCSLDDVTKYSLEMQVWWRDHQKADELRIKKEEESK